jgi:putative ABC transport system permease protein
MAARPIRLAAWAGRGAWRAPLHSGLVIFASLAGIASLAVSTASTEAGRRKVAAAFDAQGVNAISVTPAQSRAVAGRVRTGGLVQTLTLADYRSVRTLEAVVAGSALVSQSFRLRAGDLTKTATVVGCEPDYFAVKHWPVRQGRMFFGPAARQALLGAQAARDLFGDEDPSGRRLTINRVPFVVAGVLAERGQRLDVANEDDQVYVPLQAAMRRLMNADRLGGMILEAAAPARVATAEAEVRARLSARHRGFARGRDDFQVNSQTGMADAQQAASARIAFFVRWVGASAAAVSIFGVLALCWIAVNARTHEIGVRRALGARAADVVLEFVAESGCAALLGSAAAIPASSILARWLEALLEQAPWFAWRATLAIAGISALAFGGMIAAASLRAGQVAPSEALRAG